MNHSIQCQETLNVGLLGIGLDTYWPQFPGLKTRLEGYLARIHERFGSLNVRVIDGGLIDSPIRAREVAGRFRREDVRIVFLHVSTYALSSVVLPLAQEARARIVVLNLQPSSAIDYDSFNKLADRGKMTGEWLAHCQACAAPEIASVFNRADIPYHLVTGTLDDAAVWTEIQAWTEAARVAAAMAKNRVGVLGHYYCGMLDVYSDLTQQSATFGNHFEILEMCELSGFRGKVTKAQVKEKTAQFRREFEVSAECGQRELDRAARTSCALDRLVEHHQLGSLAYYYEGAEGNEYQDIVTSVIPGNSLLTAHGVPVAGECEVKNAQAMKIMDLFGAGGSFSEFYAMDFHEEVVLLGHDGPGHMGIAEGRVKLVPVPVYHGKPGLGLSIQMSVKLGPITLLSVVQQRHGRLKLLTAQGESVPGPTLNIGNTNSRYRFNLGAAAFVNAWSKAGPAHHCAIGVGHISHKIEILASLLSLDFQQVC